jgi:ATP-dependent protease ClpP protease subunit
MEGHIYIQGQIGSDDKTKGVELVDVVSKMEQMKSFDNVYVHINSTGGFVNVGNAIYNYLKSFSNVSTIAEGVCMSIATKIHLAAPLSKRFVQAGCEYLIHNPLFANVSGNADELMEMAKELEPTQKELEKTYINETGLSIDAVKSLMKAESKLSDEQIVSMRFASAILPKQELKAVALFDKNKNEKNKFMSNFKVSAMALICKTFGVTAEQLANVEGREQKAMVIETDKGTIETPYADLMEGDPVMIGELSAGPGDYLTTDGKLKIVVGEDGLISEIVEISEVVEETMDELKAKLTALETENQTLKASVEEMTTEQNETLALIEKAKALQSTYRVPTNNFRGKPAGEPVALSVKERIAQRKQK